MDVKSKSIKTLLKIIAPLLFFETLFFFEISIHSFFLRTFTKSGVVSNCMGLNEEIINNFEQYYIILCLQNILYMIYMHIFLNNSILTNDKYKKFKLLVTKI